MSNVASYTEFVVPTNIVSKTDLTRLVNEFERVDNALTTAAVRTKAGGGDTERPAMSEQLSAFLEKNTLDLENSNDRTLFVKELRLLKDKAPIVHMTFAVVADAESVQQLAAWYREAVHPQTIIAVHMQPALVAGVYLRTPNHVHDLSLRAKLHGQHDALVKELETLRGGK
jgi:F0F1-type ATP synthase delta subunit